MYMPDNPATGLVPGDANLGIAILQVVSHVTLLAAIIYTALRRHVYLATAGGVELVISICYHLCRGAIYCFGLLRDDWRKLDNVGAIHLGGAVALHLLLYDRGRDTGGAARTLLPFVALVAVVAYPYQMQALVFVALFLVTVAAYRFLITGRLVPPSSEDYYTRWIILGAVALVLALSSFFYSSGAPQENTIWDGIVHSLWHIFIGIAMWLFAAGVAPPIEWWDIKL